jgi:nicotinate phosphoribosyltransferase
VDTYDTHAGILHAIAVGKQLRERGHDLLGIRLDSGDLAELSRLARRLLDAAGFSKTSIVASNDLDEYAIEALKRRGAAVDVWGVGTKLVTAYDQPALGVVYKLTAVRDPGCSWQYRLKLSEQPGKATLPGLLQVRRYRNADGWLGDAIFDAMLPPGRPCTLVGIEDPHRRHQIRDSCTHEDLLVPVIEAGRLVSEIPSAAQARARATAQLSALPDGVRSLRDPIHYPIGLEPSLQSLRTQLSAEAHQP